MVEVLGEAHRAGSMLALNTFKPKVAGLVTEELRFSIDDDVIKFDVTGGSSGEHYTWDYGSDRLKVPRFSQLSMIPFRILDFSVKAYVYLFTMRPVKYVLGRFAPKLGPGNHRSWFNWDPYYTFRVDERSLSDTRSLIFITPVDSVASDDVPEIDIRKYSVNGWNTVCSNEMISIARRNSEHAATVKLSALLRVYEDAVHRNLNLHAVANIVGIQDASLVMNYVLEVPKYELPRCRSNKPEPNLNVYSIRWKPGDDAQKTKLVVHMQPILVDYYGAPLAHTPAINFSNALQAYMQRIYHPSKESQSVCNPGNLHYAALDDFVAHFKADLDPYPVSELFSRVASKTYKKMKEYLDTLVAGPKKWWTFLKAEVYQEEKDPRMIWSPPADVLVDASVFSLAATEWLKQNAQWYAFGKTPREIAEQLGSKLVGAPLAIMTDMSRFEGRLNAFFHLLVTRVINNLFGNRYEKEVGEIIRKMFFVKGRFVEVDLTVDSNGALPSGHPWTSIIGTICNAFINYMALYETYGPNGAWDRLGMYGGDDGVTPFLTATLFNRTATSLGMSPKAVEVKQGEFGVNFLSRYFGPNIMTTGDPSSIADVPRAMSKFHTCVKSTMPLSDITAAKVYAYYLSDRKTPVFGDFLTSAHKALNLNVNFEVPDHVRQLTPYVFSNDRFEQWPQEGVQQWAQVYLDNWKISPPLKKHGKAVLTDAGLVWGPASQYVEIKK